MQVYNTNNEWQSSLNSRICVSIIQLQLRIDVNIDRVRFPRDAQMYSGSFGNHKIGMISMFYPLQIYSILDKVKKSSRIICWNGLNEAGLGCRCANVRHDNECLRLPRIIRCRNTTFGMSLYGYAYIWISPLGRVWCRMRSTFPWKSEREKKIYIYYTYPPLRTRLLLKQRFTIIRSCRFKERKKEKWERGRHDEEWH